MKKFLVSFFSFALIFSPFSVFASDLCLTEWGTSAVNGTYIDSGTHNAKPYYLMSPYEIFWSSSGGFWTIALGSILDDGDPSQYYATESVATPDLVASWTVYGGDSPAGEISVGSCGGGGSIEDNPFGSSTVVFDPTLGDISLGLAIIITLISVALIAFIWNTISDRTKKPWRY